MTSVYLRNGESFDSLLRRFKRATERSGLFTELKMRERFEKPSQKAKRKQAAAIKREQKRQEKFENVFRGNQNFRFSHDKTEKIPLNKRPARPNYRSQVQNAQQQTRSERPYQQRGPRNNNYQNRR